MPKQIQSHTPRHFDPDGESWHSCFAEQGRMYPESQMSEYQGHWYCRDHFQPKMHNDEMDIAVEIEEDPEGGGPDFVAVVPDTYGNTDR